MGLNSDYKKRHKPLHEGQTTFHQGYYTPELHPEKCLTLGENIFRSGLERNVYKFFDSCDAIVRWGAEPLHVEYQVVDVDYCLKNNIPVTNVGALHYKKANYHIDAWIELIDGRGNSKKIFVEIKPFGQTLPPVAPPPGSKAQKFKSYNYEAKTYIVNQAKWKAARKFVEDRGCMFIIITERYIKNYTTLFHKLMNVFDAKPGDEIVI